MLFISPTRGRMDFEAVYDDIRGFVAADPSRQHTLIIGSDSHTRDDLVFVSAVVIHRKGKGARYYYSRSHHRRMHSLRQKILYETSLSLTLAGRFTERLSRDGYNLNIEIHLDVGTRGETKDLIREIVGMVSGSGYDARIKPDSFGASTVADKYTK